MKKASSITFEITESENSELSILLEKSIDSKVCIVPKTSQNKEIN